MLKIENLSVAVQGRQILHDINLHIKPGEVHVLFGPNGTGKSTLIGTIMGFERYEVLSGKIYFKGHDITEAPCYERARLGVGVMIQRPPTIRGLSLRQMIRWHAGWVWPIFLTAVSMKASAAASSNAPNYCS